MSRKSQERRAAKRKARVRREGARRAPGARGANSHLGSDGGGGTSRLSSEAYVWEDTAALLQSLVTRVRAADRPAFVVYLVETAVAPLPDGTRRVLDEQLTLWQLALVGKLWEQGWQPRDLLHATHRMSGSAGDLAAALIVEQARLTEASDRAPTAWLTQLGAAATAADTAGLGTPGPAGLRIVDAQLRAGGGLVDAWTTALRLTAQLVTLPGLGAVTDPPSAWGRSRPDVRPVAAGSDRDKVMAKIRALLAKAEATNYPAEAEALTAKAQDLMTRHAIDEALLHAGEEAPVDVAAVRVHVQAPYAGEKVSLLNQVALANRAKVVWHDAVAMATLVGTPLDVDAVEMLFTSLLIQATRAMAEAGAVRPGSFDRSTSFRRSFLVSYAVRVGERLAEAAAEATSTYGTELVPVLARQDAAVADEFARLFPHVRHKASGARYSQRGWEAGRAAADRATFVAGRIASS